MRRFVRRARRSRNITSRRTAPTWEENEEFPIELYKKAAAAGITGIGYPEALGGQGGDISHVLVACEELILAGRSVGTVVGLGTHGIALPPIVRFGTPEQQARFVKPCLVDGKISALAITEPGGGSDVAALTTRAERDGDHYVVTGAKTFITSGTRADFVTAAVRTGGAGHGGVSLLVIESARRASPSSKKLKKTGWWASDTAELHFDGCRVPVANRIGPEHGAFPMIMMNFAGERLALAAQCVAIARARVSRSGRVREGAQGVRQGDRRVPGHAAQARGHGEPDRRGACADERGRARGSCAANSRRASRRWRRTPRRICAASSATKRCRFSAATATCARRSSSGCIAMRGCIRSAAGRARS